MKRYVHVAEQLKVLVVEILHNDSRRRHTSNGIGHTDKLSETRNGIDDIAVQTTVDIDEEAIDDMED